MELDIAHKRCLDCLINSIERLQGQVKPDLLEPIAELIIRSMSGPWRYFHTSEHIFEVGGSIDPIEVLAALFHDLVYVQVDHGVSLSISTYIFPFVQEEQGQLVIRDSQNLPQSEIFELITTIFGFSAGQSLSPFGGQNEFLSALIAGTTLEPFLESSLIAQIAACIEATIPFRPKTASGLTPSELLYQRLSGINTRFNLGWDEDTLCQTVKRAVRLANRDVENFAFSNSTDFLDNTWNLMPETNHELINANSYTVSGYRKSLQKMEGFMNFLDPELVFQRFRGEPDEETYAALVARTRKNLEVAKLYLGIKLVTIAILEALSYRLGRDIPVSTMMGELPAPGRKSPILEQFLPDVPMKCPPKTALEQEVLDLLSKGRNRESVYDIKNSPVSTFIVRSVGFSSMDYLLKRSKEFFAGKIESEGFLSECDAVVVDKILEGVSQLFDSRKIALHKAS